MLEKLNILLGVSGGVAAYKAVDLASKLTAAGANVRTILTENACRLVGAKSFEAVTSSAVYTSLWDTGRTYEIDHIELSDWAKIVVIAPATANIIGKIANGICDDMLSTAICACWPLIESGAAIIGPAMNSKMWSNPAVQRNIEFIKKMGFILTGPAEGRLACGSTGIGRMSEPKEIFDLIEATTAKIFNKA
jgi:phosphopantothenoylcysteine synthetase/decarboxylase